MIDSRKSYKREVGALILLMSALITARFWLLDDPILVRAYAPAWGTGIIGLIACGLAPFGIHHIWKPHPPQSPPRRPRPATPKKGIPRK